MSKITSNKQIFLIVTGFSCNNNCVMCSVKPKSKNFPDRTTQEIIKDLIKGRKENYERMEFTGGEPTIRKDILYLIKQARNLGYKEIAISTNGRLLSYKSFCDKLVKQGLNRITFTLHAHKKQLHEIISCTPGSFEQTLAGIKNSLNYKNLLVSVNTVIFKSNYQYIFQIGKFIHSLGVPQWNILDLIPDGYAKERYKLLYVKMTELSDALYSLKPLLNDFQSITFFDFPLCVFHPDILNNERANFVTAQGRLEITKQIGYSPKRFSTDSTEEFPTDIHKERIDICQDCIFSKECAGIWKDYLNLSGDEEIKKLATKHACLRKKFHPRLKEPYSVDDFIPQKDDLLPVLKKINPEKKVIDMFKDKEIETFSHQNQRTPKILYINIDEKCNQDCVFCVIKGENKGKFGAMSKNEAKETIKKFIDFGGKDIVFTGGEPTLRDDLPEIIEYAEQFNALHSVSIITNGVRLSNEKYFNMLVDADKKNKMSFCISLHSHKEKISELLTNSKGTFKKTISGIKNIIKKRKRLSIYQVITSKNYKDFLEFAKFLNKKYPEIEDVTFAYPFPQGNALLNDWIYVKLSLLKPQLIKTLKFLENKNYTVNIAACGQFPLCAIPGFEEKVLEPLLQSEENISGVVGEKSFHEFEMASKEWISQYKGKTKECEKCILNKHCQGFWKKYTDLFNFDGIEPINKNNFKGNKIKSFLKSEKQVQGVIGKTIKDKMNLIILTDYTNNYLEKLTEFLKNNKIFCVILYKDNVLYPK